MTKTIYLDEIIGINQIKNYVNRVVLNKGDYLFNLEIQEKENFIYDKNTSDYCEDEISIIPVKIRDAQFYVCPLKKDFHKNNFLILKNKLDFIDDSDLLKNHVNEENDVQIEKIKSNVCFVIIYSANKKFYELFENLINEIISKYHYYLDTIILS